MWFPPSRNSYFGVCLQQKAAAVGDYCQPESITVCGVSDPEFHARITGVGIEQYRKPQLNLFLLQI